LLVDLAIKIKYRCDQQQAGWRRLYIWLFDSQVAISYRRSIVTKSTSSHFRDNGHQTFWGHDLDVTGSGDVIGHMTIWFPGRCSYRCSIVMRSLFAAVSEILSTKHIGVMTFTFQGNVTSSVTWAIDSQMAISYRCSIVTKSLSPAVSEIMDTKHIGVMTLTFQGHVTSSVTWPLDLEWVISYWWSVGPKSLYLTVSEISAPNIMCS